jgi:hypothetical protein
MPGWTLPLPQRPLTPVPRADCLDGSGGAMAGGGLAAPAPILAAMFVLTDGLRATRFPIGLTVAVIRGQRATGPAGVVWLTGPSRGGEAVD